MCLRNVLIIFQRVNYGPMVSPVMHVSVAVGCRDLYEDNLCCSTERFVEGAT